VRIWVKSEVKFFDDPAIPFISMMDKTIKFIQRHKKEKTFDGIKGCQLDYGDDFGALYMKHDESVSSIWRLLWASAENDIGDWYRKEFGNVYRLSEEIRDRGIAQCGQWAGR
jgi:hypothetical protein